MRELNAQNCGRENDLIAFLYGELNGTEKNSFESHLHSCRLCQFQTSEFRSIRESVVAWRDESIGHASVTTPAASLLPGQPKVSALAALRAFFDLSPLWMKGAVGFAAMLFCVLSVLAVVHLRNAPAVTTQVANNPGYSQQQLNALVEQRVQKEIARRKATEQEPPPASSQASVAVKNKTVRARSSNLSSSGNELAANARNGKARRPLSKAEREQLAADLRLVSSVERGLDLTGDQINQ